jgi:epoxyqueuosine reductase
MTLETTLKTILRDLGFELSGIALPAPTAHVQNYEHWLDLGLHASMGYLARDTARARRADPSLILPAARAVLVAGMRYPSPALLPVTSAEDGPRGKVAAYAWNDDYHLVLPPLLQQAVIQIETLLGRPVSSRIYTDTGPILERDFASQAGLGWIGKNTCLIAPQHGSYFLLTELFLDVPLEPDPPFPADYCGTCTRCIDACPTSCIRPDRTLDSARCISYLTIENKGPIPADLRPQIGNWVFGCDICQQVCPWNIRQEHTRPQRTETTTTGIRGVPHPQLINDLNLSPQEFNQKFNNSPVQRARRRGYLRNLAVALGNSGDTRAISALIHCLEAEAEPLVRVHAAWALGQFSTLVAREALSAAQQRETDPAVLAEIHTVLEQHR